MTIHEKIEENLVVKAIGIGGSGTHSIHELLEKKLSGLHFSCIDTDLQTLKSFANKHTGGNIHNYCEVNKAVSGVEAIAIGQNQTRGLSTGGDVALGQRIFKAEQDSIKKIVAGSNLIFLISALGGGLGASLSFAVAQEASNEGALVIAFALMPFAMEGGKRWKMAEEALQKLKQAADAVIVVPNDLLLQNLDPKATVLEAFSLANTWIYKGIHAITTILFKPGFINLDFASLRQVFSLKGGKTLFALGRGEGENYTQKALQDLKLCPLLHTIEQARQADNILINLISGEDISITTINTILSFISEHFGNKNKTCIGSVMVPGLKDSLEICLIGSSEGAHTRGTGSMKEFESPPSNTLSKPKKNSFLKKWMTGDDNQSEFQFVSQGQVRGYFDHTDRNHHNGEDLDVPTYLRKGIKINI